MTHTGHKFDLLNPSYNTMYLEDIARALSLICRFGGHPKFHYSVAQHCILGALKMRTDGLSNRLQLYFLLHDAAEAYYGDIPSPLKHLLPEYKRLEKKAQVEIWKAFGIAAPTQEEWDIVKHYDRIMIGNEIPILMKNPMEYGIPLRNDEIGIESIKPDIVEKIYYAAVIQQLSLVVEEGGLLVQ